jgi:hypothetical protein
VYYSFCLDTVSYLGRLLRDLGLGGLFVMTSLANNSKRMLRRNGVVTRIEVVDASSSDDNLDLFPHLLTFVL